MGSGGGSVGRAVASDTRDPRFESQHRQTLSTNCTLKKDENKEKEARNGQFKKKICPNKVSLPTLDLNNFLVSALERIEVSP